jgi:hypothetical protein
MMKFLIALFIAVYIAYATAATEDVMIEKYAEMINTWSKSLDELKDLIKAEVLTEPECTDEAKQKFFAEMCSKWTSTMWTCNEFKDFALSIRN